MSDHDHAMSQRRLVEVLMDGVPHAHEIINLAVGVRDLISMPRAQVIFAYAPWSRAATYTDLGLLAAAAAGANVHILLRHSGGALCDDVQFLVDSLGADNVRAVKAKSLDHRKLLFIRRDETWVLISGSSNHTPSGMSSWIHTRNESHLNDEWNTARVIPDDHHLLRQWIACWQRSSPAVPSEFPLRSTDPELDDDKHPKRNPDRDLHRFQEEILNGMMSRFEAWQTKKCEGAGALLCMPTGTGKTITAMRFLANRMNYARMRDGRPVKNVLWIAPNLELLDQAQMAYELDQAWFPDCLDVVRRDDDEDDDTEQFDTGDRYTILFRTSYTARKSRLLEKADIIVIDEIHYGSAMSPGSGEGDSEQSQSMLQQLVTTAREARSTQLPEGDARDSWPFVLGITATPYRSDLSDLDDISDIVYGIDSETPEAVVYDRSKASICEEGGLKLWPKVDEQKLNLAPFASELDPRIEALHKRVQRASADAPGEAQAPVRDDSEVDALIKKLGREPCIHQAMADKWKSIESEKPISMAFAVDREAAFAIAAAFDRVPGLTGKVQLLMSGPLASKGRSDNDIAHLLNNMPVKPSRGKSLTDQDRVKIQRVLRHPCKELCIEMLVVVNIGTTGLDLPDVDTLFMSRPTLSTTLYMQMLGRGMRGPLVNGKDSLRVIDCYDLSGVHESNHVKLVNYATATSSDHLSIWRKRAERIRAAISAVVRVDLDTIRRGDVQDIYHRPGLVHVRMPKQDDVKIPWKWVADIHQYVTRQDDLRNSHRIVVSPCEADAANDLKKAIRGRRVLRHLNRRGSEIFAATT